ncbi:hypothetical protein [Neisseria bergeri]|uniref:hypothetical protein n=1 Tax=Neisseria bergeri TaxID=1906581 RepID=UPI0027DF64AD|nr:hypothetical protein [Neisseria bergeri]
MKIPTLGSVFFRLPDLMGLSVLGLFRPDIAVLIRFCIIGWYFRYGFGQLLRAVLMLFTVVSMGRRMLADFMAFFLAVLWVEMSADMSDVFENAV